MAVRPRIAFSMIELMIVIALISILAAIAAPRYFALNEDSGDASLREQLHLVRGQIELYRWQVGVDPPLLAKQWGPLVDGEYLASGPINPLNDQSGIAGSPGNGVGWVWRDRGDGTYELLATDRNTGSFFSE